jgi:C4-type Zn-finger protein
MPKSQSRRIECPYCHRELLVSMSATKVPKHANKKLPSATCPGSGYPITKEK